MDAQPSRGQWIKFSPQLCELKIRKYFQFVEGRRSCTMTNRICLVQRFVPERSLLPESPLVVLRYANLGEAFRVPTFIAQHESEKCPTLKFRKTSPNENFPSQTRLHRSVTKGTIRIPRRGFEHELGCPQPHTGQSSTFKLISFGNFRLKSSKYFVLEMD